MPYFMYYIKYDMAVEKQKCFAYFEICMTFFDEKKTLFHKQETGGQGKWSRKWQKYFSRLYLQPCLSVSTIKYPEAKFATDILSGHFI